MQLRAVVALLMALGPVRVSQPAAPVAAEFRVFDGPAEVTPFARVRVWPAGERDADAMDARTPTVQLPAAVYDAEARLVDRSGVVNVKRIERLAIMHYPDEGGRHLEVINFQPGFGALQLRATDSRLRASSVALFRAGERSTPTGKPIAAPDYVLFVVPAGRYDVRVQHAEHDGAPDTHWLVAVDVPPDGTRLKIISQP